MPFISEIYSQGVGRALFGHLRQQAAKQGAAWVQLEADPHAVGFYERMGAQATGEEVISWVAGTRRALPVLRVPLAAGAVPGPQA